MSKMRTGVRLAFVCLACLLLLLPVQGEEEKPRKTPVDLNSATAAELVELPGVGEVIAQRIIRHRTISGPFRSVNELLVIRGISRKKLEALRPLLTVRAGKEPGEGKSEEPSSP